MNKNFFSQQKVLLLAFAILLLPVTAIEFSVLNQTHGIFTYPLDDVFIHMALAKNLAFYHNWGINHFEFASASSSIFYTILLAGLFKVFSAQIIIPFLINLIAGSVLLIVLQKWLREENINHLPQLVILLCIIFFSPLPILIVCGMEHTIQCLFSFLFIFGFSQWIEGNLIEKKVKWILPWPLIIYGMLICFIRYEGLFLVGIAGLILLWHRKLAIAIRLGFLALLPLIIFGIYSMLKGSYFLPNSVLLKSEQFQLSFRGILHVLDNIFVQRLTILRTDNIPAGTPRPGISLLSTQRLLIILPLAWLVFRKYIGEKIAYHYILLILTACTVLQLSFASTGWLYRYEAYLIFCSVTLLSVLVYKYGREILRQRSLSSCLMLAVVLFGLLFPLVLRSGAAFSKTSTACINIYQQQYQMGLFLHKYYNQDVIAANDIGAVSYLTDAHVLDLWGLGNIEVARSRKGNYWTPDFLDSLVKNKKTRVAVVYESWFSPFLLNKWIKVASWQIPDNVICGDDRVYFFAIDRDGVPDLKRNLVEFEKTLPLPVTVQYY